MTGRALVHPANPKTNKGLAVTQIPYTQHGISAFQQKFTENTTKQNVQGRDWLNCTATIVRHDRKDGITKVHITLRIYRKGQVTCRNRRKRKQNRSSKNSNEMPANHGARYSVCWRWGRRSGNHRTDQRTVLLLPSGIHNSPPADTKAPALESCGSQGWALQFTSPIQPTLGALVPLLFQIVSF